MPQRELIKDYARRMSITVETARRWGREGKIVLDKIGTHRTYVITPDDMIETCTPAPPPPQAKPRGREIQPGEAERLVSYQNATKPFGVGPPSQTMIDLLRRQEELQIEHKNAEIAAGIKDIKEAAEYIAKADEIRVREESIADSESKAERMLVEAKEIRDGYDNRGDELDEREAKLEEAEADLEDRVSTLDRREAEISQRETAYNRAIDKERSSKRREKSDREYLIVVADYVMAIESLMQGWLKALTNAEKRQQSNRVAGMCQLAHKIWPVPFIDPVDDTLHREKKFIEGQEDDVRQWIEQAEKAFSEIKEK